MLRDALERRIEYLRLSLTEGCNLRCTYCMPLERGAPPGPQNTLGFDEIIRMVRILVGLGVRRVRLTGGEPLLRRDLPLLIRRLKGIFGLQEVLLTTNGVRLKPLAAELHEAGLEKINIHLDTLSPERFRQITGGRIEPVLAGIEEARRVGFSPVKINAVIQRGTNDDEAEPLLRYAADRGLILRFIELMPIGPAREMMPRAYLPLAEIRRRLAEKYTLVPLARRVGSGPAVYDEVKELGTLVGFIAPLSRPFCEGCDRIRIASDGRFQDCLAYDGIFSLLDLLRGGALDDADLARQVAALIRGKREGHGGFDQPAGWRTPCMSGIGG